MIICPHCERPAGVEHDNDRCNRRRFTRRFFFGLLAAPAVVKALPNAPAAPAAERLLVFDLPEVNAPEGSRIFSWTADRDCIVKEAHAMFPMTVGEAGFKATRIFDVLSRPGARLSKGDTIALETHHSPLVGAWSVRVCVRPV